MNRRKLNFCVDLLAPFLCGITEDTPAFKQSFVYGKHFRNLETRPVESFGLPHSDNAVYQDLG
jgi:hypothetical protein